MESTRLARLLLLVTAVVLLFYFLVTMVGSRDRKSTRLNSSHQIISYAVFSFKKKINITIPTFFFFNDTATTEIYTLSLHDALPISGDRLAAFSSPVSAKERIPHYRNLLYGEHKAGKTIAACHCGRTPLLFSCDNGWVSRSEEHTSELQSPDHLVCRLLLQKKNQHYYTYFFFF